MLRVFLRPETTTQKTRFSKPNKRNFALNQWAKFRGNASEASEKKRRKLIPMADGVNFRHSNAARQVRCNALRYLRSVDLHSAAFAVQWIQEVIPWIVQKWAH